MNENKLPFKEISCYIMGKKVKSAVFGNWKNPQKAVFIFTGNCSSKNSSPERFSPEPSAGDTRQFAVRIGFQNEGQDAEDLLQSGQATPVTECGDDADNAGQSSDDEDSPHESIPGEAQAAALPTRRALF